LGAWSPKRGLGLAFGVLATALFVFEMLYPVRRPRARPLRTAKVWLQAHVYLGVIALLAVLVHCGFALPRGAMGWGLLVLSAWTVGTGLVGVWLQKWIPSALCDGLRIEAVYERIPALIQKLVGEADKRCEGRSDVLRRFYQTEVREALATLAPSWGFLLNVRSGRDQALEPFRRIATFLEAGEREAVHDLEQIYSDKLELDAQHTLQGILRGWIIVHVPPAGLLMALIAVHVMAWVLY